MKQTTAAATATANSRRGDGCPYDGCPCAGCPCAGWAGRDVSRTEFPSGCGAVEPGRRGGRGHAEFSSDHGDRGGTGSEVGLAVGSEIRRDERLVMGSDLVRGVPAQEGLHV